MICVQNFGILNHIPDDTLEKIILPSALSSFDLDISDEILSSIDLQSPTSSLLTEKLKQV